MKHFPILILFLFFGKITFAQDTISLKNASFEWSSAIANSIPSGWEICSRPNETPPDVHSKNTRHYKVNHVSKVGENFIGLVVRSNFTYESIHQKLKKNLQKGKSYKMEIYAAMSDTFESHDSKTSKLVSFTTPAIVRIWGVKNKCETLELLYESQPIDHVEWKKLDIEILPKMDHDRILIEAFYDKMITDPYNGNVLLDGISKITEQ
ncbi:MAG: hypothetical protein AB8H03_06990 [Saprospiraceae bacterium]